jgi:hypothetical protein
MRENGKPETIWQDQNLPRNTFLVIQSNTFIEKKWIFSKFSVKFAPNSRIAIFSRRLARLSIMRIIQHSWSTAAEIGPDTLPSYDATIQLVLVFGSRQAFEREDYHQRLRDSYPQAEILLCSTAGEILGAHVIDDSISVTAIAFEKSTVRSASVQLSTTIDRLTAGTQLAQALQADDLALVMVLSDGQSVNGSELVTGFNAVFGGKTPVVGGLAGDGAKFEATLVGLNAKPTQGVVAAIGLYGPDLEIGFGSQGGWEPFGPERIVTAAKGNVLYELDGQSALTLYKSYLGDRAGELPGAGLLFPLSFSEADEDVMHVRTLLAVNEAENSMTFAGDVPLGATVRLMRAGFDRLIDGAAMAAGDCNLTLTQPSELAILVSCVGRKLVLNQRVEEEVEEVAHLLGNAAICGFYAYGELSPSQKDGRCELHNQTMTITTISER